jgi:hypothetical protein
MPTRKQKRREAKSKRHEYEFVYVDDDGNEVEAPDEKEPRANGSKPAARKASAPAARRRGREPMPPSWNRAAKRAVMFGAIVFVLFGFLNKSHNYVAAGAAAVLYTAVFIPFTYALDRYVYRRSQASSKR